MKLSVGNNWIIELLLGNQFNILNNSTVKILDLTISNDIYFISLSLDRNTSYDNFTETNIDLISSLASEGFLIHLVGSANSFVEIFDGKDGKLVIDKQVISSR